MTIVGAPPVANSVAPDFEAYDTDGQMIHLDALAKAGPVVVAFFPKAFTSG
ncbi:MAG: redoxin domain-containing protein [Myxococcota bacterium]|nr:redoxin domain-containing protein [Myxococcota bacterium]